MSFNFPSLSNNINMHLVNSHNQSLPKILQQQISKNNIQHQFTNNPNEIDNVNNSSINCEHHDSCNDNSGASNSELVFNGMIGMQPQMLMLPSVMLQDPSSILSLQQFPILNLPSATVTSNNNNEITKLNENQPHTKELIQCKSCQLVPPNPNAPPPTTRERPKGCKTIFVGGLPENITQEIIQEIFERCGEITTLRLSKKNFCHIRFSFEASVDSAIYLSGYRVKINNSNEPGNTGKLHVDFAQARDDQYEYECKQRQLIREMRHKEKARGSSASPPLTTHYTDHEASVIAEKLKSDETFLRSVQTLIAWLEKGDCNKKNSNVFYSMIQSTNSHTRRLFNEKNQFEDELKDAKEKYQRQMMKMVEQFNQIEKVFKSASHKKVWDHFTRAQRRNIDEWCKQVSNMKVFQCEMVLENDDDIEMEMSDDEQYEVSNKKPRLEKSRKKNDQQNYDKKCDVDLCKDDSSSDQMYELKEKQIKVLQETIRNLQRKLLETNTKEKEHESKINELEEMIRESNVKELLLRTKIVNRRSNSLSTGINDDASETSSIIQTNLDSLIEAQIISFATAFLVIHPKGAKFDSIFSYLQQFIHSLNDNDVYEVLMKHEKLFYTSDVIKSENKNVQLWSYKGFQMP